MKNVFLVIFFLLLFVVPNSAWLNRRSRRSQSPRPPCSAVNCRVGSWTTWGPCSHRCGTSGTMVRTRPVVQAPTCGGSCSYRVRETESCNWDKCSNGGSPHSDGCSCRSGFTGTCCESGPVYKQCGSRSSWQLAFQHDHNGLTVAGEKSSLIKAVLSGARVRVVLGTAYSTEADNLHVHDNHVFAQLLQHVSVASWGRFQNDAYWWWAIVSTNGFMHMTRYNVGSNFHRGVGPTFSQTSIKWYVQTAGFNPEPTYANLANGNAVKNSLSTLVRDVQNGQDIRCVSDKTYTFPLQNVAINSKGVQFVSGQNVDHISYRSSPTLMLFQSNAYWWFTVVTSRGLRDMSRWTVGLHQAHGHTQDTVGLEWFADGCWEEVLSHDASGQAISGSRPALTSALMSGHRVRFQVPGWNYYTAEADNLSVRNGHVTVQALKHVSKNGLTGMQSDAYWYWLMVSTTGTVRATRYNVGDHTHRGDSTDHVPVKWFVDTRSWEEVLSNDQSGAVLSGSRAALVQAVRAGRDVRCVQGDKNQGYAYKAQNLAVSDDGTQVSAQALNHVSMMDANQNEVQIQPNAYWWFTFVSSTGLRDMSRWTVGKHEDRGHTSDKVGQTWFVN